VAVALFPTLSDKLNRRKLFFWCIAIMLSGIILFSFAGGSLTLVLIAAELFALPQPLVFLVVLMLISDSVEYGQLKLNHRDESLTLSVRPLLDKLAGAISNGAVGLTADAAGMTTGATASSITPSGQLTFKIIMFGLPFIIVSIGAFVFYRRVTLTEDKHAEIVDQLEKTWGKKFENSQSDLIDLDQAHTQYYAPIAGTLEPLATVSDPAFASGALTLIHIGINTVSMQGTGFITYFDKGQRVKRGDLLIEFWDKAIQDAQLDDTVMVTITNANALPQLTFKKAFGSQVSKNDILLEFND